MQLPLSISPKAHWQSMVIFITRDPPAGPFISVVPFYTTFALTELGTYLGMC